MNPRQRVIQTLAGESVDRPPVDLWYTGEVLESLYKKTDTSTEPELWRALGIDKIAWISPEYTGPTRPLEAGTELATPWGCLMRRVQSGAAEYLEYCHTPLADMEDPEELGDYPWWPDPEAYDLTPVRNLIGNIGQEFATLGPWISFFEIYCAMRGLEEAMVDLLVNPEFLVAALDRIESIQTRLLERMFADSATSPDMIFVSDDMASQHNLFMSIATWEEHIEARLRRWCELAHRHGAKVFYHSDGAVAPLIPNLIAAGIDILNPLQHICPGMELKELGKQHGELIAFHGGVDTQNVLPFGTVEDVRRETNECLDALQGSRYICGSCHNLQAGTPVENILALIETVKSRG